MRQEEHSNLSPPQILALLERFSDVLSPEKLQFLQSASEQGNLSDQILDQQLGADGQILIGLGVATSRDGALLRAMPKRYLAKLSKLGEHIKAHAPALLEHPRIRKLARRIANIDGQSAANVEESTPPFDDVAEVSTSATYLSVDNGLVPTTRISISLTNGRVLPALSLRLGDAAFVATAFVGSLAAAVADCERVAKSGLLAGEDIEKVREWLDELELELDKLKASLQSEPFRRLIRSK